MERRTFLALVSGSLLAAPLAAEAQQAGKVFRIGILGNVPPTDPEVRGSGEHSSRGCAISATPRVRTSRSSTDRQKESSSGCRTSPPSWFVSRST